MSEQNQDMKQSLSYRLHLSLTWFSWCNIWPVWFLQQLDNITQEKEKCISWQWPAIEAIHQPLHFKTLFLVVHSFTKLKLSGQKSSIPATCLRMYI